MIKKVFALMVVLLAVGYLPAVAEDDDEDMEPPHYSYIEKFEGTKTCLECHMDEAKDVFHSAHYQWKASTPDLVGTSPEHTQGKMGDINDFCTNPGASWIEIVKNDKGEMIADGCSKCHIGFGKKPSATLSEAELENIDCLICHAPGYQRKIVETDNGYRWVPKDDGDLLTIRAKNVMKPSAPMCLRCHAGAGGGTNFKRGDLESAHFEPEEDLDVHFANDMACVDCHTTKNHRIAGRGVDLSTTDLPGVKVACENCHESTPHGTDVLNRHVSTVACTVCHIPDFARYDATDMNRDWSHVHQHENGKWEAVMDMEKHVKPAYAWWNGKTVAQDPQEPVTLESGKVLMAGPDGSIKDPDARIYAFKLHQGKLPMLKETKQLIPIYVNHVFKTGDVTGGVIKGAKDYLGRDITKDDFTWVSVERYMGLFHEVLPAKQALKCNDCHGAKADRLDWEALGYKGDPRKTGGRFDK